MIDMEMLKRDRDDLAAGLEGMRKQHAELTRAIAQQEGALWYAERLIGGAGESHAGGESDAGPEPHPDPPPGGRG